MVYARTHTRDLSELEGLQLAKALPFAAITFAIASFASMGLPGFSGFVAELQVLIGAWEAFSWFAVIAGVGILIGVVYTLRVLVKAFYHDSPATAHAHAHPLEPISQPERIGAALLIFATLAVGLYPRVLLDLIVPSFDQPLFEGLRRGVGL
jgi:NADH-quinone oxidoreductase subunit M